MVYADLEGTITDGIAELKYASSTGRLTDAEKILKHMLEEERRNLYEAKTLDKFIEMNERSRHFHIKIGAELLKGFSPEILFVQLKPTKISPKIFEMGKRDGNLSIVTCTDERTATDFCEKNNVPFYNIAASSKLKVNPTTGVLNGKLERYCGGKTKACVYTGREDVVGNSTIDLPLFKEAVRNNRKAYFVKNGGQTPMEQNFLYALEKFEIPFIQLY